MVELATSCIGESPKVTVVHEKIPIVESHNENQQLKNQSLEISILKSGFLKLVLANFSGPRGAYSNLAPHRDLPQANRRPVSEGNHGLLDERADIQPRMMEGGGWDT